MSSVILGAVAMASFVAALFFLKFWTRTRDRLFLFFSIAFFVDALSRFLLGTGSVDNEHEPLFYVARLVTFGLIIFAVVDKNTGSSKR
jgi:Family of unknown function (DUF5985)